MSLRETYLVKNTIFEITYFQADYKRRIEKEGVAVYQLPTDMMELLPAPTAYDIYRIKKYLDKWYRLFLRDLGNDTEEAMSATLLYTLNNLDKIENEEHLERYVKTVTLAYKKRKEKGVASYEDYMVGVEEESGRIYLDTIEPLFLQDLLSNSKDLIALQKVLKKPETFVGYDFYDPTFKKVIQQQLQVGLSLTGLVDLVEAMQPYVEELSKVVPLSNYERRMNTEYILEDLPCGAEIKLDLATVRYMLRRTLPVEVQTDLSGITSPDKSKVVLAGRMLYVSDNGKVTDSISKWVDYILESVYYDIVTQLEDDYDILGMYDEKVYMIPKSDAPLDVTVTVKVYNRRTTLGTIEL